jgi:hypothetical protein
MNFERPDPVETLNGDLDITITISHPPNQPVTEFLACRVK